MATYNYLNKTGLTKLWTKAKAAFADKESTNTELAKKFELPSGGTTGQILTKTDDGTNWSDPSSGDLEVATDLEFNNFMGITVDPINSPFSALSAISKNVTSENKQTYINTYSKYLGKIRTIDLGDYGTGFFQLIAICEDKKSDGTPLLFSYMAKQVITKHIFNSSSILKYTNSSLRNFVTTTLYNSFPSEVKNYMQPAKKTAWANGTDYTYNDKLWVPSRYNVNEHVDHLDETYTYFVNSADKETELIRFYNGVETEWWIIYQNEGKTCYCVDTLGSTSSRENVVGEQGVIVGFCI